MYKTAVSRRQFKREVLQSPVPVLVNFWGNWCILCKQLEPVLADIEQEYLEDLKVFHLNVEDNMMLIEQYQIFGTPTLILFVDGYEVDRMMGSADEAQVRERLFRHLL